MKVEERLKSGLGYGLLLLRAAVEGARSVKQGSVEQPRSVLLRSARASLASGVAAASLGLAAGYLLSRRRTPKLASFGVMGAVVGFAGGMAWGTRRMTGGMARGAIRKLGATRDAHWLAKHPVDYA
jgi:hypothetical protein